MAAQERLAARSELSDHLAELLPKDTQFTLYHISTPPERTDALCAAPPDTRPTKTYLESHFLAASISVDSKEVLAFAIEILIYSTASTTTFFVSKADSTGYLGLLNLPKGVSPIKEISAGFLRWIVGKRHRENIPSIISLFARAQDQYLFPGSIENAGKHVLTDRGLIRWWCKVLDIILQTSKHMHGKGHLLVPGVDKYETSGFLPHDKTNWSVGHPLADLFGADLPPRCVIPHFPDDPKARYLDELDAEVEGSKDGTWRTIKTLDQFWEMMAIRQECSAGRLVGFVWVVIERENQQKGKLDPSPSQEGTIGNGDIICSNGDTKTADTNNDDQDRPTATPTDAPSSSQSSKTHARARQKQKIKLIGPIQPRAPKAKTHQRQYQVERPESTPHYIWPADSRGEVVTEEKDYKRVTELLLRLDFANLDLAVGSSERWISEVNRSWGRRVVGGKEIPVLAEEKKEAAILNMGLVRKKRKAVEPEIVAPPAINLLSASMVRKKPKA